MKQKTRDGLLAFITCFVLLSIALVIMVLPLYLAFDQRVIGWLLVYPILVILYISARVTHAFLDELTYDEFQKGNNPPYAKDDRGAVGVDFAKSGSSPTCTPEDGTDDSEVK